MRFNFVAKIDANTDEGAKVPFIRKIDKEKVHGMSMNLTAIAEQNNRAFLEMAGFKNDKIQTFDNDRNKIEIDWDDRNDPDVIKSVAGFKRFVIAFDDERHEFITEYDFIEFVRDHLDDIKGKVFTITGQIRKNEYNGKITDRFQINSMYEVTDERKNQFRVYGEFFFSGDGVDTSEWKHDKKITFNGYTTEYIDKNHKDVLVAKSIIFDASKIDFENERHVALLTFKLKQMGVTLDGEAVKVAAKKNAYYAQNVVLNYINGAEKKEFDESSLTETQREMVALGLKRPEDFAPAGSIYGDRVQIYKLIDFDLRGEYENGLKRLEEKASEIEDRIYVAADDETLDSFEEKMNKPVETKSDDDDMEDDLFS